MRWFFDMVEINFLEFCRMELDGGGLIGARSFPQNIAQVCGGSNQSFRHSWILWWEAFDSFGRKDQILKIQDCLLLRECAKVCYSSSHRPGRAGCFSINRVDVWRSSVMRGAKIMFWSVRQVMAV